MLGSEKAILLSIEAHLVHIQIPFERFYHPKENLYFFSMFQPFGKKESAQLIITVYPNQIKRIELRCLFSLQLRTYFNQSQDVYRYLNDLNALDYIGKYGIDANGRLFSGYTFLNYMDTFSPVHIMSCLLDLFEEGEKIYIRLEKRNQVMV